MRTKGSVLVARKDSEYYFIDSVFKHDFAGCTGIVVYPVTETMMDDMLSIKNLEERFGEYWEEEYKGDVDENCEACDGWIDEDGCEDCGYPSLKSFCEDFAYSDDVIDNQYQCVKALNAVCEDEIEYADCTGCGRIFGRNSLDDFDEVYNRKALVACLAYEDGAVSYDNTVRVIFNV